MPLPRKIGSHAPSASSSSSASAQNEQTGSNSEVDITEIQVRFQRFRVSRQGMRRPNGFVSGLSSICETPSDQSARNEPVTHSRSVPRMGVRANTPANTPPGPRAATFPIMGTGMIRSLSTTFAGQRAHHLRHFFPAEGAQAATATPSPVATSAVQFWIFNKSPRNYVRTLITYKSGDGHDGSSDSGTVTPFKFGKHNIPEGSSSVSVTVWIEGRLVHQQELDIGKIVSQANKNEGVCHASM